MGAGDDDRSIRIYQRALNFGSPLPSKCRLFKLVCWRFKQILAKAALKIGYMIRTLARFDIILLSFISLVCLRCDLYAKPPALHGKHATRQA